MDNDDKDRDRTVAMKTAARSREAEEEHESSARKVRGIGDAAVWSGNRVAGALYVLKGDTIVRISVGGGGSQEQKIERSKPRVARLFGKSENFKAKINRAVLWRPQDSVVRS